jgi:hypothetical protein
MKLETSPLISEKEMTRREKIRQAHLGKRKSPEAIQKTRQSWIGRKHSAETKEKLRLINTGNKHSVETRKKMSQSNRANQKNIENLKKIHQTNTGKKRDQETIEKTRRKKIGQKMKTPLTAMGPDHHKGLHCILRSPSNVTYHIKNVTHFVRKNPNLFDALDLIIRSPQRSCPASSGLLRVGRIGKSAYPTWKGWTRVTAAECNLNDGVDLLGRAASSHSTASGFSLPGAKPA